MVLGVPIFKHFRVAIVVTLAPASASELYVKMFKFFLCERRGTDGEGAVSCTQTVHFTGVVEMMSKSLGYLLYTCSLLASFFSHHPFPSPLPSRVYFSLPPPTPFQPLPPSPL